MAWLALPLATSDVCDEPGVTVTCNVEPETATVGVSLTWVTAFPTVAV